MHVSVIINPSAGSVSGQDGTALSARVRALLSAEGMQSDVRVLPSGEIDAFTREALAAGTDAVVVGGGDGTTSLVAGVLAGTPTPLGLLPLGTRNHLAKDLNIPPDLASAVRLIGQSRAVPMDVAEVNGRIFVNNSSIGFYPQVVAAREQTERQTPCGRSWATGLAALRTLFRHPLLHVRLEWEDKVVYRSTPFVFVGNNLYTLKLFTSEFRPRLDAGQLCVFAARCTGVRCLLRLAWRALRGRLDETAEFDSWCARELRVRTHRKTVRVAADGEVMRLRSPLHYRVRAGAIRVFVPAAAAGEHGQLGLT